ncbi:hypothetical protein [Natrialba sp. PRR66]|uniref:hypothetical protein n=1 Tax=Natrialba sp. PRR66 TaxID=3098146 RepID=UPI002B1D3399|nr:hypothetical protein [Natrialba sp. PRR66]
MFASRPSAEPVETPSSYDELAERRNYRDERFVNELVSIGTVTNGRKQPHYADDN